MKVRFHLPDFSGKFRFNLIFASMLEQWPQYFREGVEIASFYGVFSPSLWNGGRIQSDTCDRSLISTIVKTFNNKNIPLRFTFTNPVLEEKHLEDKFCNMVLNLADNGLNEVIVVSPILENYIREKYPNYKVTSSTCKRITDPEKLSEELEKDYHIVVIDYDFNNKFDILEKIPNKEKCELLVNACCQPNCKLRSEHYQKLGIQQIEYCEHIKKYPNTPFDFEKFIEKDGSPSLKCQCMKKNIIDIKNLSTHITPDDIWEKYVPMGFNQFKIEGRTSGIINLAETYLYYMVKPECIEEARLMLMHNLEANGVLICNE